MVWQKMPLSFSISGLDLAVHSSEEKFYPKHNSPNKNNYMTNPFAMAILLQSNLYNTQLALFLTEYLLTDTDFIKLTLQKKTGGLWLTEGHSSFFEIQVSTSFASRNTWKVIKVLRGSITGEVGKEEGRRRGGEEGRWEGGEEGRREGGEAWRQGGGEEGRRGGGKVGRRGGREEGRWGGGKEGRRGSGEGQREREREGERGGGREGGREGENTAAMMI